MSLISSGKHTVKPYWSLVKFPYDLKASFSIQLIPTVDTTHVVHVVAMCMAV